MERQQDTRRPLPRRGQVKAGIFASLFRCIFPGEKEASQKLKEGNSGGGGGGGRRVAFSSATFESESFPNDTDDVTA
uniref:Uncharacterized protein n=1 Tax=Oryza glaberrima TaxID=4538 RepID=I1PA71_ORYGL